MKTIKNVVFSSVVCFSALIVISCVANSTTPSNIGGQASNLVESSGLIIG